MRSDGSPLASAVASAMAVGSTMALHAFASSSHSENFVIGFISSFRRRPGSMCKKVVHQYSIILISPSRLAWIPAYAGMTKLRFNQADHTTFFYAENVCCLGRNDRAAISFFRRRKRHAE